MTFRLTKHHGLGNDFLVLLAPAADLAAVGPDEARRWCDRHRGVGADGLLLGATDDDRVDLVMTLFNADGSRAEMSGNGIRCLVQAWAAREGKERGSAKVWTDTGLRVVEFGPGDDQRSIVASVSMGAATSIGAPAGWIETGIDPMRPCLHLSMGNPHAVVAVDDVDAVDLLALGAQLPDVNLEVVAPLDGGHGIRLRVHERGAGITEACGTGAAASALAAVRWGMAVPDEHGEILVRMDGGDAKVRVQPDGELVLIGPATFIASIEIQP